MINIGVKFCMIIIHKYLLIKIPIVRISKIDTIKKESTVLPIIDPTNSDAPEISFFLYFFSMAIDFLPESTTDLNLDNIKIIEKKKINIVITFAKIIAIFKDFSKLMKISKTVCINVKYFEYSSFGIWKLKLFSV